MCHAGLDIREKLHKVSVVYDGEFDASQLTSSTCLPACCQAFVLQVLKTTRRKGGRFKGGMVGIDRKGTEGNVSWSPESLS